MLAFQLGLRCWLQVALAQFGRVQMRYRRVSCTPPSDIKVAVDEFSSAGGWMRLSIDVSGAVGAVRLCASTLLLWSPFKRGRARVYGAGFSLPITHFNSRHTAAAATCGALVGGQY